MNLFSIIDILDFILPRICASCKCKLKNSERIICNECNSNLEIATNERIQYEFQKKFLSEGIIKDFISPYIFHEDSVIQNIIHVFKYNQNFHIANFLAQSIIKYNSQKLESFDADYIIPVPLHHLRKAERGYNQAAEIARQLSKHVGIKYNPRIIKRNRFTTSQTKFTLEERNRNIRGAFKFNKQLPIKDKKIILVDDVITTGATVSECARILYKNKVESVFAVSAAIAD